MEERKATSVVIKPRIANDKRRECLELFDKGFGYKKTARISGLKAYTVRDYLRRYKAGDLSWAERGRVKEEEDCPDVDAFRY